MHPALEKLAPIEARGLVNDFSALDDWLTANGLPFSGDIRSALYALASQAPVEVAPPRRVDPRRKDPATLVEFVDRAAALPLRLRQVAAFCLEDGLSLSQCAKRLGISRETVRVHLRRLRAVHRMVQTRDGGSATISGGSIGGQATTTNAPCDG